jgi:hypothetical protein
MVRGETLALLASSVLLIKKDSLISFKEFFFIFKGSNRPALSLQEINQMNGKIYHAPGAPNGDYRCNDQSCTHYHFHDDRPFYLQMQKPCKFSWL